MSPVSSGFRHFRRARDGQQGRVPPGQYVTDVLHHPGRPDQEVLDLAGIPGAAGRDRHGGRALGDALVQARYDFLHELELNVRAELTLAETGQPYKLAAGVPIDEWLSDPADDQRYEINLRSLLGAVEALEDGSGPGRCTETEG